MIVEPKMRGFICTTAHPTGCSAHVQSWIDYVQSQTTIDNGPKKVLVIGSSTGYGLASRINAAFACNAQTMGVFFEKESSGKRTASAGWYNNRAFEKAAHEKGLYATSFNGDAFSDEVKQAVIERIQQDWGGDVDLIVYSLASPVRKVPATGELHRSCLKPIGQAFSNKTIDLHTGVVSQIDIEPAEQADIDNTVTVMGGEDWGMWIDALAEANVLSPNFKTVAYSYIGPQLTYPIYREGTIGRAKAHLEQTARELDAKFEQGSAFVSVNKALVTQASSAIPVVPLYISILYRIMKDKGLHEGCIEQMYRLFNERLYTKDGSVPVDEQHLIRIDDWEMRQDVQAEVDRLWHSVTTDNITELTDIAGCKQDFYRLFGFDLPGVDYQADVEIA